ncbi:hypothetical protein DFH06DRAFT_1238298 [Mycena polygramma]|nr:hypothetical protein DFH06DRAFT_1238298 [Mycena polygramma]
MQCDSGFLFATSSLLVHLLRGSGDHRHSSGPLGDIKTQQHLLLSRFWANPPSGENRWKSSRVERRDICFSCDGALGRGPASTT